MPSKVQQWAQQNKVDITPISATFDDVHATAKKLERLIGEMQDSPEAVTSADQTRLDRIQSLAQELTQKTRELTFSVSNAPSDNKQAAPRTTQAPKRSGSEENPDGAGQDNGQAGQSPDENK